MWSWRFNRLCCHLFKKKKHLNMRLHPPQKISLWTQEGTTVVLSRKCRPVQVFTPICDHSMTQMEWSYNTGIAVWIFLYISKSELRLRWHMFTETVTSQKSLKWMENHHIYSTKRAPHVPKKTELKGFQPVKIPLLHWKVIPLDWFSMMLQQKVASNFVVTEKKPNKSIHPM